ncbi:MAG: response regulator [Mariprofundaceae bacterium]|nr:response regulator [Mariprofundaceae bacterium]
MDYSQFSMHDLFRLEAETQLAILSEGILQAASNHHPEPKTLEAMMRAAHSLKGAARIIQLNNAVTIAHQLEDAFVAMQEGRIDWQPAYVSPMLSAVDLLQQWADEKTPEPTQADGILQTLTDIASGALKETKSTLETLLESTTEPSPPPPTKSDKPTSAAPSQVRISPQQIEQMLGMANEIQAEWQWLQPLTPTLQQVKRHTYDTLQEIVELEEAINASADKSTMLAKLTHANSMLQRAQHAINDGLLRLEQYNRTVFHLSQRLHDVTIASRMQPFVDATQGLTRMVYDLGQQLGKPVKLSIQGADTLVDREILEKIKVPLQQLLRNAIDHGIDDGATRLKAGKNKEGHIRLEAMHQSGILKIIVADDGGGIKLEGLRKRIIERGHASAEMVAQMHETELLSFLFLPGFSMRDDVGEISGRGVGLDVVDMTVRDIQGVIHIDNQVGQGTTFELHLPVSLAVTRALHISIGGQSYAVPLARLQGTLHISNDELQYADGHPYIYHNDHYVDLLLASTLLGSMNMDTATSTYFVILLGTGQQSVGLIVDRFVGIVDLVEKPLPKALGKVPDIAACAVLPDGNLLYMLDTQDIIHHVTRFIAAQQKKSTQQNKTTNHHNSNIRILVVDDSITVREAERKILQTVGYNVEVAIDGVDAWNMLCSKPYDLLITDVDMPHLDGIELLLRLREDHRFATLPVIVVSYKENEKDRMRGLEAGADAYLSKASLDDSSLLMRVNELIGEANA